MVHPTTETNAMGRVAAQIILDEEETETLEHWQRSSTVSSGLCFRAAIVLDCAAGYSAEKLLSAIAPVNKPYRSGGDASHNIDLPVCPMLHAVASPDDTKMPKSSGSWKRL